MIKLVDVTTFNASFNSNEKSIDLKYELIRNLLKDPKFNIYVYKDRISK